jgi:hypothetical protein
MYGIRIRNSDLRIRGSGSESKRNIYESKTLLNYKQMDLAAL